MTARCVMVLGTTSGAGKSWLATALCRWYARQGLKVAPFKAQNMSNNARVVAGPHENGGGEIGSAQYFQALAARALPDVRMNPLLLKPESDTHSQVVLLGQVDEALSRMPWRERGPKVWPQIARALDQLRAENDVVVIEGAGSPAEINLMDSDIVNMRVAQHAAARCLLITDIDRGGAFAHLYGTWALLNEAQRQLIHGFVLNKFRGDMSLLAPGPQMLEQLTGVPTVATLPMWWHHGLPEEDGVNGASGTPSPHPSPPRGGGSMSLPVDKLFLPPLPGEGRGGGKTMGASGTPSPHPGPLASSPPTGRGSMSLPMDRQLRTIAIVSYPRISNLDEFQPLRNIPGVRLVWARSPDELASADWIILPGSKHTSSDLAWLRAQRLDRAIAQHAERGGPVLGVCGGLQMLGEALIDPNGIDGNGPGLGLLPLVTVFEPGKTVRRTSAAFGPLTGPWAALSGVAVEGYEIHHGRTSQHTGMAAGRVVMAPGLGWQNEQGNVLGVYLHGLFEDAHVLRSLFGASVPTLDSVFDGLADFVERHFEKDVIPDLVRHR
jgi:adenosylcobyric acid synthase